MPATDRAGSTSYVLAFGGAEVTFAELASVVMEAGPGEFIGASPPGHAKQYGKTVPPHLTLRRPAGGVASSAEILGWHQAALAGAPGAYRDGTLKVRDSAGQAAVTYVLNQAWPSQVAISGAAGSTPSGAVETVTISCDSIIVQQG